MLCTLLINKKNYLIKSLSKTKKKKMNRRKIDNSNSNLIALILSLILITLIFSIFGLIAFATPSKSTTTTAILFTFTSTMQSFVQPNCFDNVTVSVMETSWMAPGLNIYIEKGGYYTVSSVIDSNHVVLANACVMGNDPVGTIVGLTPVSVRMAGTQGIIGPTGALGPTGPMGPTGAIV
jgi:hypothetical protein